MGTDKANKTIAEFMGWGDNIHHTISPSASTNFLNNYKKFDSPDRKISLSYYWDDFEKSLPYHTSWDWLMDVVEKIEKLGFETSLFVNESKQSCKYDFRIFESEILETKCRIIDNTAETKIKAVWNCVIEFIKWYNEQK